MKTKIWYVIVVMSVIAVSFTGCNDKKKATEKSQETTVVDAAHNSRNSLDYEGVYTGTLPCADCSGIYTEITLSGDNYQKKTVYQGKEDENNTFETFGKYNWNDKGNIITLEGEESEQYQVGENQLFVLDIEGKRITGDLAEFYVLKKK